MAMLSANTTTPVTLATASSSALTITQAPAPFSASMMSCRPSSEANCAPSCGRR